MSGSSSPSSTRNRARVRPSTFQRKRAPGSWPFRGISTTAIDVPVPSSVVSCTERRRGNLCSPRADIADSRPDTPRFRLIPLPHAGQRPDSYSNTLNGASHRANIRGHSGNTFDTFHSLSKWKQLNRHQEIRDDANCCCVETGLTCFASVALV